MVRSGIYCLATLLLAAISTQSAAGPLIHDLTAQRYGLQRAWFAQVQMDRSRDRIQNVTAFGGMLLVQTKRGVIQALDAETGKSIWVNRVGSPQHPTTAIGASHDHIAVTNGSILYVYERATGRFIWKRPVNSVPGAGPGLSNEHVFVPTISGMMEAYKLTDHRKPAWRYNSGGRALVQPVVSKGSVSWPTDRGLFYVAGTERLSIRFRTEAQDEIVAQPAHVPPYFYLGALDGYLYKVHERSGAINWRFSAGEPVVNRPVTVNGRVYITAQHGGLYCLLGDIDVAREAEAAAKRAAEDRGEEVSEEENPHLEVGEGNEIWWTPGIVRLLAVTPNHVYGMDKLGRIRIVRTDTGSPVDMMQTEGITLQFINHTSDRIYIGTETGLIQCLHESDIIEPLSYVIEDPIERAAPKPIKQRGIDDGEEPELGGGGDDPFSTLR